MRASQLLAAAVIGLGATLLIDLWALVLQRVFGVQSLNYCFLGRWVLHIPAGRFAHENIAKSPAKPHECTMGWVVHYSIGATFAAVFRPLPHAQCAMDPATRAAFETRDPETDAALDPILFEHRDMMYAKHLELPLAL